MSNFDQRMNLPREKQIAKFGGNFFDFVLTLTCLKTKPKKKKISIYLRMLKQKRYLCSPTYFGLIANLRWY